MVKVVWGVPRKRIRESSLGVRIDSASVQSCNSFSRINSVIELPGTSMSSRIIRSARLPVSCPVMPTDFTLGAWWGEHSTSKLTLDHLASSDFGRKWESHGVSIISFCRKIDMLSARSLDAEMIIIFRSGSRKSVHRTKAPVIQLLPTPRKAWIWRRLGPCWI